MMLNKVTRGRVRAWQVGLIILAGALLAGVGFNVANASLSQDLQPSLADLLLQKGDFPYPPGLEWERSTAQNPEELAKEIARFTGLSREGTGFLEASAVAFFSDPDSDLDQFTGVVHGIFRYENEGVAEVQYRRLLQGLAYALGSQVLISGQTEWSSAQATGWVIDATDVLSSAHANWFVGTHGDLVTVMQVWSSRPGGLASESSDKALLTNLLPKALGRITGVR